MRRNVHCLSEDSPKPIALAAQDAFLIDGINRKTALSVKVWLP